MSFRWSYIFAAYVLLLTAAYLDNMRGAILPLIKREYDITHSLSSWMLISSHIAAVVLTALLIPLFKRVSDRTIVVGVSIMAVICCVWPHYFRVYEDVLTWSLLLGGTMATMGALCNILMVHGTPAPKLARSMSGMHAMYGIGSMCAPLFYYSVGITGNWQVLLFGPLVGCAVLIPIALRLERQVSQAPMAEPIAATPSKPLTPKTSRLAWLTPAIFVLYVIGEVTISMWMTTYFTEHLPDQSSLGPLYMGGFFACLASTRILASFIATPARETPLLYASLGASTLFFVLGLSGHLWGFVLAGVLGPFYPIMMARTNQRYAHIARRITVIIMVTVQVALAINHRSIGAVSDHAGIAVAYRLPIFAFVLCLGTLAVFDLLYKRNYLAKR